MTMDSIRNQFEKVISKKMGSGSRDRRIEPSKTTNKPSGLTSGIPIYESTDFAKN